MSNPDKNFSATGYLLYLLAATLWAFNGTISKIIMSTVGDVSRVAQFRISAAFVVLFFYVLVTNRKTFRLQKSEIPILVLYSLVGISLTQWAYFQAISRMPVGIALLIEFTAPIYIVLWVRYGRKQNVHSTIWLGLALAIGGLALVAQVWKGFTLNGVGFLFASLATAALVFYFILGEKASNNRDSVSLIMFGFGVATIFWAIILPWTSYPFEKLIVEVQPFTDSATQIPLWVLVIYMVIGGTVLPFVLAVKSLRFLGAAGASLVGMLEPPIAFIVAWVVLQEALSGIQIIGGIAMLIGIYVAERARKVEPKEMERLETIVPS